MGREEGKKRKEETYPEPCPSTAAARARTDTSVMLHSARLIERSCGHPCAIFVTPSSVMRSQSVRSRCWISAFCATANKEASVKYR